MRPVRLRHERIYGLQSTVGQFQVVGQHDDGNLWPDLPDLSRDDSSIQETEVVLEDNCIHGPQLEKLQRIATVGRDYQLVSIFLQQTQLSWIPVYAE
jgi:hypothetical protein